jgi:hypothetical protein
MGHTDIISKQLIRRLVRVMAHYILGLELKVIKELRTESEQTIGQSLCLQNAPTGSMLSPIANNRTVTLFAKCPYRVYAFPHSRGIHP